MEFEKIFQEVKKLNKLDKASNEARMCKLGEECGELFKSVNKTIGRKVLKATDTKENIRKEIIDEAADVVQNVLSVIDGFGFNDKDLLEAMEKKNKKWALKGVKRKKQS